MKLKNHFILSLFISSLLYSITRSFSITIASFISGIFIDCDHILDYWREYGLSLNIRHFFESYKTCEFRKLLLIFHAWEWVILWGIVAWFNNWHFVTTGVFIGVLHHLIADQITNPSKIFGYFFFWRMFTSFECDRSFSIDRLKS